MSSTAPTAAHLIPGTWIYDIGGDGWGNDELETYTIRRDNSFLQGGRLIIRAKAESYRGSDGIERSYTSARLKSQGLFSQARGKFEARMRLPRGQGVWPAFWMLGDDVSSVGWPACGELDIMENIGREPTIVTRDNPRARLLGWKRTKRLLRRLRRVCGRLSRLRG